jgi:predicted RNA-binding protein associated with RNAse of E/G family
VSDLSAWVSTDVVWAGGSLFRLLEPGAWHSVDVEFDAAGAFAGWYVNLQEPLRRTGSGFDTVDLVLDLVVAPRVSTPATTICWPVRVRAWALWTDG